MCAPRCGLTCPEPAWCALRQSHQAMPSAGRMRLCTKRRAMRRISCTDPRIRGRRCSVVPCFLGAAHWRDGGSRPAGQRQASRARTWRCQPGRERVDVIAVTGLNASGVRSPADTREAIEGWGVPPQRGSTAPGPGRRDEPSPTKPWQLMDLHWRWIRNMGGPACSKFMPNGKPPPSMQTPG